MEFSGQYLTYQEYKGLGGTLDMMPFNLLEIEARKTINKYTFNRLISLESQIQEVKLCVNELITILNIYNTDLKRNRAVSSESIDGYSVSYLGTSIELEKGKTSEIKGIVEKWLSGCKLEDGTPYLYRGVK